MESTDILQTVAQIAMGLAGFGGIAAGLGYRARGNWSNDDQFRLLGMVYTSFVVVFTALLPFVVHHLGILVPWRVCAFFVLPLELVSLTVALGVFRHGVPTAYNSIASILLVFIHIGTVAVLLAVCSNLYLGSNFGLYLLAAILILIVSAILFFRLLSTSFKEGVSAA
jgi:hypothetical protein